MKRSLTPQSPPWAAFSLADWAFAALLAALFVGAPIAVAAGIVNGALQRPSAIIHQPKGGQA